MEQDNATIYESGFRSSALIETLLMLVVLLVVDFFLLGGTRYWDTNPHPFWFIVLLVSCKYGSREGLFATLCCSIALLVGNMPDQNIAQDMYSYWFDVVKLPLMWLVAAVVFGELRQMHIRERDQLRQDLAASEERETTITRSYQWVKELKERLELRVAGQLRSSVSAYHAAKSMERLNPDQVSSGLKELISNALNPDEFSLYTLSDNGLELSFSQGWKESHHYNTHFDLQHPLTQAIAGGKDVLCVINNDHEQILSGQGVLAGALVDNNSGQIMGMLKIETLGFTDLNLSTIESFSAICEWAGLSLVNARKYQEAKAGSIVNPDHNLYSSGYFNRYMDFMTSLAKRVGFDVNMIVINITNASRLDEDTRLQLGRALSDAVNSVLRDIDMAFDYQSRSDDYSIVLPATPRGGAEIVLDRIQKKLTASSKKISPDANFSFNIQSIYEKA